MAGQGVPVKLEANAVVAVDVVLFTVRETERIDDAWQGLMVQRDDAAFAGKWSLPGVVGRGEETFADAAQKGHAASFVPELINVLARADQP